MTPKERKSIIRNEIIVDAHDDYEVNMSWYYYFEEKLMFPFEVFVKAEFRDGNSGSVRTEVTKIVSTEGDEFMLGGFYSTCNRILMKFKISEIAEIIEDEYSKEILNHWLFWKGLPLLKIRKK